MAFSVVRPIYFTMRFRSFFTASEQRSIRMPPMLGGGTPAPSLSYDDDTPMPAPAPAPAPVRTQQKQQTPSREKTRRDISQFGHGVSPDDLYQERSITFLYNKKTGELSTAFYPKTHLNLANDDMKMSTSREQLMGGYILGRMSGVDGGAIGFWGSGIQDGALMDCLGKLVGKFPKLQANKDDTVVFSHNSESFPPFMLGDKPVSSAEPSTSQVTDAPNDSTDYNKQFNIGGRTYTLADILRVLHAAPKTGNEYRMVQDYIAASDEKELADVKNRMDYKTPMKKSGWSNYWQGAKPWASTSESAIRMMIW